VVDVVFAILYVNNNCSMVCSTSFRVVLYNHVAHLRCINLLKLPPRRILFEILAVGTSIVLVEEGSCGVDAGFELLISAG
jgi:hypothetical protein